MASKYTQNGIISGRPIDWIAGGRGRHQWAKLPERDACPQRPRKDDGEGRPHDRTHGPVPGTCRFCGSSSDD